MTAEITGVRDSQDRASLGVYLQVYLKRYELPVEIQILPIGFTGSSAGLPIFLEIIHQLRKEDIAHGEKIACSGEITETGTIKPDEILSKKLEKFLGIKLYINLNDEP